MDDFVIVHKSKKVLCEYKTKIDEFLKTLQLELHPNKCKIIPLERGINLLGFKVFYHYKIIRKRNLRKIKIRLKQLIQDYKNNTQDASYILNVLQGWNAYRYEWKYTHT